MTEVYEGIAMVVFILISLIFIKPPAWSRRMLKYFVGLLDRWL